MSSIKLLGVKAAIAKLNADVRLAQKKAMRIEMYRTLLELKARTPVETGEARDAWRIEGNAIINDCEHIIPLNEGSSPQAPAHFIEQTVLANPKLNVVGFVMTEK